MHTGILLAVEAVNVDEAFDLIESFNESNAGWSDWNEAWGRWKEDFPNGALCYRDAPDKFLSLIDQYHTYTMNNLYDDLKYVGNLTMWQLVMMKEHRIGGGLDDPAMLDSAHKVGKGGTSSRLKNEDDSNYLNVFRARSLLELVDGSFSNGQHFFDVTAHTPNKECVLKRVEKKPEDQWLIVWDYHF